MSKSWQHGTISFEPVQIGRKKENRFTAGNTNPTPTPPQPYSGKLSGDVHYAEISKFENTHSYPIYDITASGLSQKWHFATPNENRIEGPVMDNHFGLLTIDFSADPPNVQAEISNGLPGRASR